MAVYKLVRQVAPYKHQTVKWDNAESEPHILACFHDSHNIFTLINLVESSHGTHHRHVTVYAMYLMELSEGSSAISMVHKARCNSLHFCNQMTGQLVVLKSLAEPTSSSSPQSSRPNSPPSSATSPTASFSGPTCH